ncbi:asparagine synthase C-terminal domain-containing protein [Patescibacteria group bacterium]|nr:asparagine synthase C-terminal domain-containing protein [Patescibacteria group bacterium]
MNQENIPEVYQPSNYEKIFQTIKTTDIVSEKENKNWSLSRLENLLSSSFKEAGQQALKDNQGVIYTTLSGGLDSTLALAFLRKNFGWETKIITFTMGENEKHLDIKYARLASKRFKTEHYEIIPTIDEKRVSLEEFKKERPEEDLGKAISMGSFAVFLLFKKIRAIVGSQAKTIIVHDGIDELMGGYFKHRQRELKENERKENFRSFWQELKPKHLNGIIKNSQCFDFNLLFPYLEEKLIKYITQIPIEERVDIVNEIGKVPMRGIARKLGVPKGIISRRKRGAQAMLEIEELRKLLREK